MESRWIPVIHFVAAIVFAISAVATLNLIGVV